MEEHQPFSTTTKEDQAMTTTTTFAPLHRDYHASNKTTTSTNDDGSSSNKVNQHHDDTAIHSFLAFGQDRSNRLYDRTEQQHELLDAFHRIRTTTVPDVPDSAAVSPRSSSSSSELVLVSGGSGTGKTVLVQQTFQEMESEGYYFVSGKFDQIRENNHQDPYGPIVSAFEEFAHLVSLRPHQQEELKQAIMGDTMVSDWRVVIDMIPALEQILGKPVEATISKVNTKDGGGGGGEAEAQQQQNRFKFVFRRFIQAISSPSRPIVLFLDDMQWADSASLDLIRAICMAREIQGFLLVMTYRDSDVTTPSHRFSTMLEDVRTSSAWPVTEITVSNFSFDTVVDMLADLLKLPQIETRTLADLTWKQTEGNVFFMRQLLISLADQGVLFVDDTKTPHLRLDKDRLQSMDIASNVVDLLVNKIKQLPKPCQDVLKIAACIGAEFKAVTVASGSVGVPPETHSLQRLESEGLVFFDQKHSLYMFAHDKIQQAAYSMIPDDEKCSFHLNLGRQLWNRMSPSELEDSVFVVVKQMNIGSKLIKGQEERYRAAALNLRAGEKAMLLSAFRHAAMYMRYGVQLIGENNWKDQYGLCLDLHNAAAEAEYCNGKFGKVEMMIQAVLDNAHTFHDKLRAYSNYVYLLGTQGKLKEAIDMGINILHELGVSFPSSSGRFRFMFEYYKTKNMLRRKTNEYLLSLRRMRNPDKLAAMQLLKLVAIYTYQGRPDFFPIVIFRMVQLSVRHGLSAVSADAFGKYGVVLCGMGNMSAGYRYGQLALAILDKFQAKEWVSRTYTMVYGCINHWTQPLSENLDQLKFAHYVGMETGDIEYAMNVVSLYCYHCFEAGRHLAAASKEAETFLEQMTLFKQHAWASMTRPLCQVYDGLRGLTDDRSKLKGRFLDQELAVQHASISEITLELVFIHYLGLVLAYSFHDFELAANLAKKSRNASKEAAGTFMAVGQAFYESLTLLALANETMEQNEHIQVARSNLRKLKQWARDSPKNVLHKVVLVEAGIAAVAAKEEETVLSMYVNAADLANKNGFIQDQALANELAGMFLLQRQESAIPAALSYFERAYSLYTEWGALGKADHLKRRIIGLK